VNMKSVKKEFLSKPKICKVDGCTRFQDSYEFCSAHYARFKKHGDATIGGPLTSQRGGKSKRTFVIDGIELSIYDAEIKYEVKADLIWLRLNKLGWTPRQAVGLDEYTSSAIKTITFRGKKYLKQEDLYKEFAEQSQRSITTMRIAMAALRNSGVPLSDELIEEALFGSWQPEDKGGFLYKITCIPTGKVYIGITSRPILERWEAHIGESRTKINSPMKRAIREFGAAAFQVEDLGFFPKAKDLKQAEKDSILENNSLYPFGLNSNKGGTLGGIDRIPVFFEGNRYRSMSDLARAFGIKPGLLQSRISQDGMSLENALKLGAAKKSGKRIAPIDGIHFPRESWNVNGLEFNSMKEIGKHFGISEKTIAVRVSAGWAISEAVKGFKEVPCPECGTIFQQRKNDHKFCSTSCKERMRGHTRRKKKAGLGNRRQSEIDGVLYSSDSEIEKIFGVNRQRFRALLKRGLTPKEAISALKKSNKSSSA